MCSSLSAARVIKSGRIREAGHGNKSYTQIFFLKISKRERQLGRRRHRQKGNIKIDVGKI
jgi:hypothetical protein